MSWVVLAPVLVAVLPPDEHRPPAQVPGPRQDGAGPPGGVAVEHLCRSQLRLVPYAVDQVPGRDPGQHRPGPGHRWRVPAEPRLSVPHLADDNIFESLDPGWYVMIGGDYARRLRLAGSATSRLPPRDLADSSPTSCCIPGPFGVHGRDHALGGWPWPPGQRQASSAR